MKRPTRTDVARRAGVSVATVSYAYSESPKISEDTRRSVFDAARELGYKPSQLARSLSTRRSMQLSMILNDVANPVYSAMISGFESAAVEKGYLVNICNGRDHADEYFESIITRGIDGVLVEVLPYKFHIAKLVELIDTGSNVVLFGKHGIDTGRAACFEIDYPHGMDLAVDHLASLGHRHIVYLSGLAEKDRYDKRIDGFREAVRKRLGAGIPASTSASFPDSFVLAPPESLTTSIADGEAMTRELLATGRSFSAVICTNDLMAVGSLRALTAAGFSVPGDVSVVGIDDASLASVVTPALTTIGSDYFSIGRGAFELLYGVMKEKKYGYVLHRPRLIIRSSTGPAKAGSGEDLA